ncbi:MAG: hypothetical protein M3Q44_00250 [bacterium]|nr:hypothetical protein [bacterium]
MANETLTLLQGIRKEMATQESWCPTDSDNLNRRLTQSNIPLEGPVRDRILDIARLAQFHLLTDAALIAVVHNPGRFVGITSATLINFEARRIKG